MDERHGARFGERARSFRAYQSPQISTCWPIQRLSELCFLRGFKEASLLTRDQVSGQGQLNLVLGPSSQKWRRLTVQPSNHKVHSPGNQLPSLAYLRAFQKSPHQHNKDTFITLITGNSKSFRSCEPGTKDEDQTYMRNIFCSSEWPNTYFL